VTEDRTSPSSRDRENGRHRLEIAEVELVGGGRRVGFTPGFNIIQGDITTGKTTLVRLIRAMLGTVPSELPPEVEYVTAVRGNVRLGDRSWQIYRPRTTTQDALVEVSERQPQAGREPLSLRLPAAGKDRTYSVFLLDQLGIPAVSVPQARSMPTGTLAPVTMTDWLGYCVVTGDELDTQVFGHQREYRNRKRRWVFELAYGYYNPELALLSAKLRQLELQIDALDHDVTAASRFLAGTPFADPDALEAQLSARQAELEGVAAQRREVAAGAGDVPGLEGVRAALLEARTERANINERIARMDSQIADLSDLHGQLSSQSARLTRAIVADEFLVDFDFVVCPRCGNDVQPGRTEPDLCYLCLQQPRPAHDRSELFKEQDRIADQLTETENIVAARRDSRSRLALESASLGALIESSASELDQRASAFVSDQAERLEFHAAQQARLQGEVQRLREYLELFSRYEGQLDQRSELEAQRDELTSQIQGLELSNNDADANVRALETRMLDYLRQLHIPDLGQELSVKINRTTYLPEIAGRTFDELSSQGLKTLVNVAHALAHHTVAIDRNLPLPGLLILDGLSANAGHEGFDQERVRDVYRLLRSAAQEYAGLLQLIAVDNEISRGILVEHVDNIRLTLTQADRLIRIPRTEAD
jgi:hypothetical protein